MKNIGLLIKGLNEFKHFLLRKEVFYSCIFLWLFFQVIWAVLIWDPEWISDPGRYQYYATQCAEHGTLYPDYSHYHCEYIFGPGWVNFLVLVYKLMGTFRFVPFLLIIMNFITLVFLLKITNKVTNNSSLYYLFGYIYILLPSNTINHTVLYSEYYFCMLATLSLYMGLKKDVKSYVISGFFISIAIWTRPMAYAWVLSILILAIYRKKYKNALAFSTAIMTTLFIIAIGTHQNFPDYLFSAKTGGVNMIMGADDTANGSYNYAPRGKGGRAYIKDLFSDTEVEPVRSSLGPYNEAPSGKWTYNQVDSFYMQKSFEWINDNKVKWLSLIPAKIYYLYFTGTMWNINYANWKTIDNSKLLHIICWLQTQFIRLVFITLIIGVFFKNNIENYYIVIPVIASTAMTVVCVSVNRYNYIFLHLAVLFSLITLYKVYTSIKTRHNRC